MSLLILGLLLLVSTPGTYAQQESGSPPSVTRTKAIVGAEESKARALHPLAPSRAERIFQKVEKGVVEPLLIPEGFSVKVGGLPSGGGFALGPRYTASGLLRDRATFDMSVVGSTQLWWRGEASLASQHIAGDHLDVRLNGSYENAASIRYFGEGPHSLQVNQTNFRREFTVGEGEARVHTRNERYSGGYRLGELLVNVGPGRLTSPPPTQLIFSETNTPGLEHQSNFLTGTSFLGLDFARKGFNDPSGLTIDAVNTQLWDKSHNNATTDLFRAQAIYRFSYANGMRNLAFRARNETAFTDGSNRTPFYLQPTLGGPNDLRGYPRYRFYGNGSTIATAEYRWSVAQALEMALFADGGNVYDRPGLIGFRDLRGDAGVGARIKHKNNLIMRVDLAVSPEGAQIWLVFNPVFDKLSRSF